MAKGYFGRDGRQCQRSEWAKLRDDRSYRIIHDYDNGEVWVRLEWLGEVEDTSVFRDCWKLFQITVGNYNAAGEIKADPVENGKTFATEEDAVKAYQLFLNRWTNSGFDEVGEFVEEDNELTPPPPPDPDAPTSDVKAIKGMEDDGVGAW